MFRANAQWDAQISNYWVVKQGFNPSFAGQGDLLNLSVLGRRQWVGVVRAPQTYMATAEMPVRFLNRIHGVGVTMQIDKAGLFSNTYINGQYAYKKLFGKRSLNVGVQVGVASLSFDAAGLYSPSGTGQAAVDEAIPVSGGDKVTALDAGVGLSWIGPDYYAGLSATHVLEPSFNLSESRSVRIPRVYYLTGGGNIRLPNPLYQIQPSVLVKATGNVWQMDVTARAVYKQLFSAGLSWRRDDGFVFLLGATVRGFNVGYSFDLSTSAIGRASFGTHELFITYSMPVDLGKSKKHSSKSVRIL